MMDVSLSDVENSSLVAGENIGECCCYSLLVSPEILKRISSVVGFSFRATGVFAFVSVIICEAIWKLQYMEGRFYFALLLL